MLSQPGPCIQCWLFPLPLPSPNATLRQTQNKPTTYSFEFFLPIPCTNLITSNDTLQQVFHCFLRCTHGLGLVFSAGYFPSPNPILPQTQNKPTTYSLEFFLPIPCTNLITSNDTLQQVFHCFLRCTHGLGLVFSAGYFPSPNPILPQTQNKPTTYSLEFFLPISCANLITSNNILQQVFHCFLRCTHSLGLVFSAGYFPSPNPILPQTQNKPTTYSFEFFLPIPCANLITSNNILQQVFHCFLRCTHGLGLVFRLVISPPPRPPYTRLKINQQLTLLSFFFLSLALILSLVMIFSNKSSIAFCDALTAWALYSGWLFPLPQPHPTPDSK